MVRHGASSPGPGYPYSGSLGSFSSPALGAFPGPSAGSNGFGLGLGFHGEDVSYTPPSTPSPTKSGFAKVLTAFGWGRKKPKRPELGAGGNCKVISKATPVRPGIVVSSPVPESSPRGSERYELPPRSPPQSAPKQPDAPGKEAGPRLKHQCSLGALPFRHSTKPDRAPPLPSLNAPPAPHSAPPQQTSFRLESLPDPLVRPSPEPASRQLSHFPPQAIIPARQPSASPRTTAAAADYVYPTGERTKPGYNNDAVFWREKVGREATPADDDIRSSMDTWGDRLSSERLSLESDEPSSQALRPVPAPARLGSLNPSSRGYVPRGSLTEEEDATAGDVDEPASRSFFAHRRAVMARKPLAPSPGRPLSPDLSVPAPPSASGGPARLPSFSFSKEAKLTMDDVLADIEERLNLCQAEFEFGPPHSGLPAHPTRTVIAASASTAEVPQTPCSAENGGGKAAHKPKPRRVQSLHASSHLAQVAKRGLVDEATSPPIPSGPAVFVLPPTPVIGHTYANRRFPETRIDTGSVCSAPTAAPEVTQTPPLTPCSSDSNLTSSASDFSDFTTSTSATSITTANSFGDDAFGSMLDLLKRPYSCLPPIDEHSSGGDAADADDDEEVDWDRTPTLEHPSGGFELAPDPSLAMTPTLADPYCAGESAYAYAETPRSSVYGGAAWDDVSEDEFAEVTSAAVLPPRHRLSQIPGPRVRSLSIVRGDGIAPSPPRGGDGDLGAAMPSPSGSERSRRRDSVVAQLLRRRSAAVSARFDDLEDAVVQFGERVPIESHGSSIGMAM